MNLKFSIFLITSHQFKRGELISGNIEESSEDGTLPDRKTSFSKIKFRPDSADNHATYACEVSKNCILRPLVTVIYIQASHPALQGSLKGTRAGSPMRASVLLSVQCEYSDKLAEMIYSHSHFPHHTPYCLETKLTNRPKTDAVQLYQLLKLKLSMVNGPKHCV